MDALISQIVPLLNLIDNTITHLAGFIWKGPVVYLCLIAGVFFTIRMGFIQFKCFPHALALICGKYDNPNETGQITHFQALAAALSGTIGLGNIAGVAIAIGLGGPGTVFWMWLIGLFGMATKYVECALGTHYREEHPDKTVSGGPMYYIVNGLGKKWKFMAVFYSVCMIFAAIGAACLFQSNQAASALETYYNVPEAVTGFFLMIISFIVIIGGITRIGKVSSKIVPLMCFIYITGACIICILNLDKLPDVFNIIFTDAFTGKAVAGGSVFHVFMWGVRRAVFSNEAGLGSAAIAHAAVKTDYPIREGMVASIGPLIDTIIVCTATATVIILSGNFGTERFTPILAKDGSALYSVNFETENPNIIATRTTQHPKNTSKLRHFVSGKHTAIISPNKPFSINIDSKYLIKNAKNKQIGLRFSYYLGKNPLHITAASNDIIFDTLAINTEKENTSTTSPIKMEAEDKINIDTSPNKNTWNSAVLTLISPTTSSHKDITLTFISPNKGTIYIDRLETVKSVKGIALTAKSFDQFIKGFGSIFIPFAVMLFAFSTIITWGYYGETACGFLSKKNTNGTPNKKHIMLFKILFVGMIYVGAIIPLESVIHFSDLMLGLVVIPNFIAIALLSGKVHKWTTSYYQKLKSGHIVKYK